MAPQTPSSKRSFWIPWVCRLLLVISVFIVDFLVAYLFEGAKEYRKTHGFPILWITFGLEAVSLMFGVVRRNSVILQEVIPDKWIVFVDGILLTWAAVALSLSCRSSYLTRPVSTASRASIALNAAWVLVDLIFLIVGFANLKAGSPAKAESNDSNGIEMAEQGRRDPFDDTSLPEPLGFIDAVMECLASLIWPCVALGLLIGASLRGINAGFKMVAACCGLNKLRSRKTKKVLKRPAGEVRPGAAGTGATPASQRPEAAAGREAATTNRGDSMIRAPATKPRPTTSRPTTSRPTASGSTLTRGGHTGSTSAGTREPVTPRPTTSTLTRRGHTGTTSTSAGAREPAIGNCAPKSPVREVTIVNEQAHANEIRGLPANAPVVKNLDSRVGGSVRGNRTGTIVAAPVEDDVIQRPITPGENIGEGTVAVDPIVANGSEIPPNLTNNMGEGSAEAINMVETATEIQASGNLTQVPTAAEIPGTNPTREGVGEQSYFASFWSTGSQIGQIGSQVYGWFWG